LRGGIVEITSSAQFQEIISNNQGKLIVVDFSATWCGPCQYIKPHFHELPKEYPSVIFLEVDVDENAVIITDNLFAISNNFPIFIAL
jgi:thiol-disulfide isomerase/thioredoxin